METSTGRIITDYLEHTELKTCATCGEDKDLSEFYYEKPRLVNGKWLRKERRSSFCKSCEKIRVIKKHINHEKENKTKSSKR